MENDPNQKTKPYGYIQNLHLIEVAYFDSRLQEQTKLTLAFLIRYAGKNGEIGYFSIKDTARKKGVTRRAIRNQINKLIEYGYLKCISRKGVGWRNQYHLLFDNLYAYKGVTQSSDTPHVTLLGDTHGTSTSDTSVTPLGDTKKTYENNEIKKEKGEHALDEFIYEVEVGIADGFFSEIKGITNDMIYEQAHKAWKYWEAYASVPKGCRKTGLFLWIEKGLRGGNIKSYKVVASTNSNVKQEERDNKHQNPKQPFHKNLQSVMPEAPFNEWIRPLWLDEDQNLCAPTQYKADRARDHYMEYLEKEFGDITISVKAYQPEPILEEI